MPSLANIRQGNAVRAFVRMGGTERKGKGSHKIVKFGKYNLAFPGGVLKKDLLRSLIKLAGVSEDEFFDNL